MGVFDSFWDEDSECPKCHSKTREWQTKHFRSFLESWKKGEFLQYRKLEKGPAMERTQRDGSFSGSGTFRRTNKYLSDAPLLFNGKVPVHSNCGNCNAWLEAYAKIVKGHFTGVVEIEAGGSPKELVLINPETTAEDLRKEFQEKLLQLQDSCGHTKSKWMLMEWAPGHLIPGKNLVCLQCEKILDTKAKVKAQ